jgi:tetratricopeptide (TPR) repeat protein
VRRKIEALSQNLEEFVEQTDYSLLVVACTSVEGMYVSQFLIALDESQDTSLFWVFVEPFESVAQYVEAMVQGLEVQLEAATVARSQRGEPPCPPLPPAVKEPHAEPARRFEAILRYLPGLLDEGWAQTVTVGLLPTECKDEAGFARLIQGILPHPERPEWLEPLRIVTLDPRERPQLVPLLAEQKVQTVLTFPLDLSLPALTQALKEDAANPATPMPERMANLLQLAALDFSYQRHAEAQEKYTVLYQYYADPHQPGMQAMCLLGTGDSLEATGDPKRAKLLFERGIDLCLKHDDKVPLLQLLISMVRCCGTLGIHHQAETYAHCGLVVARLLLNGPVCAFMAEKKGDAQLAQRKRRDALETYDYARKLAEIYKVYSIWKSVLEKLEAEHAAVEEHDLAGDMRREWRRVDALEKSGGGGTPHGPEPKPPAGAQAHA